ncbi:uncharacterized protein PV07_06974 [Cladophialophora immunda]|uniref:Uncharacterized protein n=1 Tax=Cladophialophora immunda TaxID=569365 RepID=A0A0D2C9V5_9EURO|nr:uncharacterized protein PV07_06974 [Cladophialophora immunda]KIW27215.1 hypothetical protein PV07_06974 [Cladophialophora immunda]OQV02044.1 hypothetical protein CLAIMM_07299 [Cladophialophora immunda]
MRRLESRLSANVFLHVPSSSARKSRRTLLFFVPGNPGLIGYYHPFLALVARGLRGVESEGGQEDKNGTSSESRAKAVVAGFSLGGFDVDEEPCQCGSKKKGEGEKQQQQQEGGGSDPSRCDEWQDREGTDGNEDMISTRNSRASVVEDRELLYPPSFPLRSRNSMQQEDKSKGDGKGSCTAAEQDQIYTLGEQIELTYARVEYLVHRLHEQGSTSTDILEQESVQVVLMGHSVGAYIALELVRLWHERHHRRAQQLQTPSHTTAGSYGKDDDPSRSASNSPETRDGAPSRPSWVISTCILLTPTIQDIHLSPSGRLATPALSYLPFLPGLAHMLLHAVLLRLLPSAWFSLLVSRATGMQTWSHGFETTMAFLRSRRGVRQALCMARGEMAEIRSETWGREVWGASHHGGSSSDAMTAAEDGRGASTTSPRLYFWFAKKDHWIADVTKEAIFASRATGVGVQRDCLARPQTKTEFVETDEVDFTAESTTGAARIQILETEAMDHAWCLNQSEFVARRVSSWLREVLDTDDSPLYDGAPFQPAI